MEETRFLIIGAGVSGLAFANAVADEAEWQCVELESEPGGYCRTVKQDGFIWDFSGHFFHFRHPDIEKFLVDRMPAGSVRTVEKRSSILFKGECIDFPFQKNIHQLPREDFIECLYDLFFRDTEGEAETFEDMLYAKLGRGITEKFLKPYNEKLYACPLSHLDKDAMGRFFPKAEVADIIRNMRHPDNATYNATFTYPEGGAIEYVNALLADLDDSRISLEERVEEIDVERRVARTSKREIAYEHLISSAPFPRLLDMCGVDYDPALYTFNKVLVFNLGFDRKGWPDAHWIYIPERDKCFYRVGFYDNIFGTDRMSLYIEIGLPADEAVDEQDWLEKVLDDLRRCGIVDGHELVSHHSTVLNPAYVHINKPSQADFVERHRWLADRGVHAIGRYGGWKYCAIEDNIVEARELAQSL